MTACRTTPASRKGANSGHPEKAADNPRRLRGAAWIYGPRARRYQGSTRRAAEQPHLVRLGRGAINSAGTGSSEYRNLNRDPRITLSLVNPEVVRIDEDLGLNCINSMTKKNLGMGKYPYHQPADKRVVIFMRPEDTTQMGV